jgi:pyruvate dehydrogenase E1 component alpha subunit
VGVFRPPRECRGLKTPTYEELAKMNRKAATKARAKGRTGKDKGDELRELLRQMMLIRRFEEKAAEMYARRKIGGFLHLYIGQEAIAVGAIDTLQEDDYIVSHYREHGHALARGLDPRRIMAELFGRDTGVSRGRGGSMHLFDLSKSFMGGYAIVAGHMPIAVGLALASACLKNGRIVLNIFGDGAVNQGEFHESLNLASVWKLPVVFLCENNLYGMGTDVRRVSAEPEPHKRACGYDMPAEQVDGQDVLAVRDAARQAVDWVRAGKGPYFLEAVTYRFRGHSMADPELYRKKTEVEHWKERDPIAILRRKLEADRLLTAADFDAIQGEVDRVAEEAVRFADESPEPGLDALYENVYKE